MPSKECCTEIIFQMSLLLQEIAEINWLVIMPPGSFTGNGDTLSLSLDQPLKTMFLPCLLPQRRQETKYTPPSPASFFCYISFCHFLSCCTMHLQQRRGAFCIGWLPKSCVMAGEVGDNVFSRAPLCMLPWCSGWWRSFLKRKGAWCLAWNFCYFHRLQCCNTLQTRSLVSNLHSSVRNGQTWWGALQSKHWGKKDSGCTI